MDADGTVPSMLYSSCKSLPFIKTLDRKERVPKGGNYFNYHVWDAEMRLHVRGDLTSYPPNQGVHVPLPL